MKIQNTIIERNMAPEKKTKEKLEPIPTNNNNNSISNNNNYLYDNNIIIILLRYNDGDDHGEKDVASKEKRKKDRYDYVN